MTTTDLPLATLNLGDRLEDQLMDGLDYAFTDYGSAAVFLQETADKVGFLTRYARRYGLTYVTGTASRPWSRKVGLLLAQRLRPTGRPVYHLAHGPKRLDRRTNGPKVSAAKWNIGQEVHDQESGRTPFLVVKHIVPSQQYARNRRVAALDARRTAAWLRTVHGLRVVGMDGNTIPTAPQLDPLWTLMDSSHDALGPVPTLRGRAIDYLAATGGTWTNHRTVDLGRLPNGREDHRLLCATLRYRATVHSRAAQEARQAILDRPWRDEFGNLRPGAS